MVVRRPLVLAALVTAACSGGDRKFTTGSGHTWVSLPLDLAPGAHRVTVRADDGTALDLPPQRRWLEIAYWSGGDEGRHISHELFDRTPGGG